MAGAVVAVSVDLFVSLVSVAAFSIVFLVDASAASVQQLLSAVVIFFVAVVVVPDGSVHVVVAVGFVLDVVAIFVVAAVVETG